MPNTVIQTDYNEVITLCLGKEKTDLLSYVKEKNTPRIVMIKHKIHVFS